MPTFLASRLQLMKMMVVPVVEEVAVAVAVVVTTVLVSQDKAVVRDVAASLP